MWFFPLRVADHEMWPNEVSHSNLQRSLGKGWISTDLQFGKSADCAPWLIIIIINLTSDYIRHDLTKSKRAYNSYTGLESYDFIDLLCSPKLKITPAEFSGILWDWAGTLHWPYPVTAPIRIEGFQKPHPHPEHRDRPKAGRWHFDWNWRGTPIKYCTYMNLEDLWEKTMVKIEEAELKIFWLRVPNATVTT